MSGAQGDYSALATKALLDGFAAIALSAALGWGVRLAAVGILILQGGLTLGPGAFDSVLRGDALAALVSAGGVLILGISLKLLDLVDVKVGNFLPALIIAPGLVGIVPLVELARPAAGVPIGGVAPAASTRTAPTVVI